MTTLERYGCHCPQCAPDQPKSQSWDDAVQQTREALGETIVQVEGILHRLLAFTRMPTFGETPDQELNRRLNMRLRGEDPGPPINWKGLPR